MPMWGATRREFLVLIVLPAGLAVGAAVGAGFDIAESNGSAALLAVLAGLVGLALVPVLQSRSTPAAPRSRAWQPGVWIWGVAAALPVFMEDMGHAVEGCWLALTSGTLAGFAWVVARQLRKQPSSPVDAAPADL